MIVGGGVEFDVSGFANIELLEACISRGGRTGRDLICSSSYSGTRSLARTGGAGCSHKGLIELLAFFGGGEADPTNLASRTSRVRMGRCTCLVSPLPAHNEQHRRVAAAGGGLCLAMISWLGICCVCFLACRTLDRSHL